MPQRLSDWSRHHPLVSDACLALPPLGLGLVTGFSWAISLAFLHDAGGGHVSYPVLRILGYLALAGLAGLLAAMVPARRAARASIIEGLADA